MSDDTVNETSHSRAADTEPAPPPGPTDPAPPKPCTAHIMPGCACLSCLEVSEMEWNPRPHRPPAIPSDVPTEPDASPEPFPLPDDAMPLSVRLFHADCAPDGESLTKGLLAPQPCARCGGPVDPDGPYVFAWVSEGSAADPDIQPSAPAPRVFSRPWHDYGLDTGPRLRVKGLVDRPGPPPADPETRGEWLETHERYKRARAEGDDHTIGQIMAPVLDALHSETPPTALPPIDWAELEPALLAELREWGRAHGVRPRQLAFQKFFGDNAVVRVVLHGSLYEARIEPRAAQVAWRQNLANPRKTAARLVERISAELATACARETLFVPDPERIS